MEQSRASKNGLRSDVHRSAAHRFSAALLLGAVVGVMVVTLSRPSRIAHAAPQADKLKDSQFIAEGAKLFAPSCGNAYCHGTGGIGGGAPRLRGTVFEPAYLFKTISNGIPGTGMLSFKSEFSEEQIWKLAAFVMSDAKPAADANPDAAGAERRSTKQGALPKSGEIVSSSTGSAQAGKALFFDSTQSKSCHNCHSLQGEGTSIGPDLSKAAKRSPRELFTSIILLRDVKDPRYAALSITLRSGDKIIGIKKEEDGESIRIYDTAELPAVLRTIQKADVVQMESTNESIMPGDYALIYTMKQLLDLVTFLKSDSKSPVVLKDLLE